MRGVSDTGQDLYLAAPERGQGQASQVVQTDQLVALAVQDRERPVEPRRDRHLIGEVSPPRCRQE